MVLARPVAIRRIQVKGGAGQGKGVETFFFGWCVGFLMRYRFTFSRLENWVNVLRLSPPATDTQRGLRFFWIDGGLY